MRILGLPVPFTGERQRSKALAPVSQGSGGWYPLIRESFAGAWQRNVEVRFDAVLSYHAVFACQTLIASDIAKLRIKLVRRDDSGIWSETRNPAYDPVLRKPNHFQTRGQFVESWILSKLSWGNTYVLKERDLRGVVVALYVLDPSRVRPLVADDGSVFYEVDAEPLKGVGEQVIVPAREIIHDRFNCLRHQLIGLSPIFANGLTATHGLAIQNSATRFFQNGSQPGGLLVAPGAISDDTAARLKAYWEENYTGRNIGKVAVLGDGLKYESMAVKAVDAQLIEQLRFTAEIICSTYHVPPYKIGIGQMPTYNNIQALNVEYYSQCLQRLIEDFEAGLDEGLGIGESAGIGTEFDLDGLLRMDSVTQVTAIKEAIGAGLMAPNEGRRKIDLPPVKGGETPYLQQQNYSLSALAERDSANPLAAPDPAGPEPIDVEAEEVDPDEDETRGMIVAEAVRRALVPPRLALPSPGAE